MPNAAAFSAEIRKTAVRSRQATTVVPRCSLSPILNIKRHSHDSSTQLDPFARPTNQFACWDGARGTESSNGSTRSQHFRISCGRVVLKTIAWQNVFDRVVDSRQFGAPLQVWALVMLCDVNRTTTCRSLVRASSLNASLLLNDDGTTRATPVAALRLYFVEILIIVFEKFMCCGASAVFL